MGRKPLPWNVVIGVSLMGVACAVAADPDYPVATAEPQVPSADSVRGLEPIGRVEGASLRFRWRVDANRGRAAAAWRIVVLDEELSLITTFAAQKGRRELFVDPDSLVARFAAGGETRHLHWFAETVGVASRLYSSPLGFQIDPLAGVQAR